MSRAHKQIRHLVTLPDSRQCVEAASWIFGPTTPMPTLTWMYGLASFGPAAATWHLGCREGSAVRAATWDLECRECSVGGCNPGWRRREPRFADRRHRRHRSYHPRRHLSCLLFAGTPEGETPRTGTRHEVGEEDAVPVRNNAALTIAPPDQGPPWLRPGIGSEGTSAAVSSAGCPGPTRYSGIDRFFVLPRVTTTCDRPRPRRSRRGTRYRRTECSAGWGSRRHQFWMVGKRAPGGRRRECRRSTLRFGVLLTAQNPQT